MVQYVLNVVSKEKSSLTDFSENSGRSSLILHQNLTSGRFLKANGNVASEIVPMKFSYCYIKTHWSTLYFKQIFYPSMIFLSRISRSENTGSLTYTDLPNIGTFHHTISKNHVNITTDLIRNV